MDYLSLILLAVGLSMDSFAVAIGRGLAANADRIKTALVLAVFFTGFQVMMPVLGWILGEYLVALIASFDHWLAFLLLAAIGGKMIAESFKDDENRETPALTLPVILLLSVATSIDALGVGLSFAFLDVPLLVPLAFIGVTTINFTSCGVMLGRRLGETFGRRIEAAGGIILIAIGIRILLEHTLF